jgi:hypothetical protein
MPTTEPGRYWNKRTGTEGGGVGGGRVGRGFHLPLISLSEGVQSGLSLTSGSCFAPQQKKTNLGEYFKNIDIMYSVQVNLLRKAIITAHALALAPS